MRKYTRMKRRNKERFNHRSLTNEVRRTKEEEEREVFSIDDRMSMMRMKSGRSRVREKKEKSCSLLFDEISSLDWISSIDERSFLLC